MLAEVHAPPDRARLTALLWMCADTSEELSVEFAKQLIVGQAVEELRQVLVRMLDLKDKKVC